MAVVRSLRPTAIAALMGLEKHSNQGHPVGHIPLPGSDACGCAAPEATSCACWSDLANAWLGPAPADPPSPAERRLGD